ncbi:MAG: hypothetical protein R2932_17895 [Caldilineaceae bacterium]|nr:type II toxin-antitoxin system Phd/YefM family antitoxin [Caldilineaceae bacterium]
MQEKHLTEMDAEEFGQLINEFIDRETKDMDELDAPLFYEALESIYALDTTPQTVKLEARMETRPVSEMNQDPNAIFELLASGPVVLTQQSTPVGVLLSPKEWNTLFDRLEELEDAVEIWKGKYELATGKDTIEDADIAELQSIAKKEQGNR